jgi:hypothetical protein
MLLVVVWLCFFGGSFFAGSVSLGVLYFEFVFCGFVVCFCLYFSFERLVQWW